MDESCYLKTLQKPFDCHKTVIIKVGERKKRNGRAHSRWAKATCEHYLVSRDFLER
jgi:hypothetical protein